mmetsp:Transcript_7166/g.21954  ORF Transcript_7166/g.21954 Transcript_7166/m.21954 type:complete len:738 (+) Transcript_7166:89-2302(+)
MVCGVTLFAILCPLLAGALLLATVFFLRKPLVKIMFAHGCVSRDQDYFGNSSQMPLYLIMIVVWASCMCSSIILVCFGRVQLSPILGFYLISVTWSCLYLMHKQLHSVIPIDDLVFLLFCTLSVLLASVFSHVDNIAALSVYLSEFSGGLPDSSSSSSSFAAAASSSSDSFPGESELCVPVAVVSILISLAGALSALTLLVLTVLPFRQCVFAEAIFSRMQLHRRVLLVIMTLALLVTFATTVLITLAGLRTFDELAQSARFSGPIYLACNNLLVSMFAICCLGVIVFKRVFETRHIITFVAVMTIYSSMSAAAVSVTIPILTAKDNGSVVAGAVSSSFIGLALIVSWYALARLSFAPVAEYVPILDPRTFAQQQKPTLHFDDIVNDPAIVKVPSSAIEIDRQIGQGGFGDVYLGKWTPRKGPQQQVAIKKQRFRGGGQDDEAIREFYLEIKFLTGLRHRNILNLVGVVIDPEGLEIWILTEYLERGSLRDQWAMNLPLVAKVKLLCDVASAMTFLHSHQPPIVHRDLKLENCLVAEDGTCVVCDFGLTTVSSYTMTQQVIGTIHILAPEIIKREKYDERVDVYSFGIMSAELLTQRSFVRQLRKRVDFDFQLIQVIVEGARPTLDDFLPPAIKTLIEECYAAEQSIRPPFPEILNRLKRIHENLARLSTETEPSSLSSCSPSSLLSTVQDAELIAASCSVGSSLLTSAASAASPTSSSISTSASASSSPQPPSIGK